MTKVRAKPREHFSNSCRRRIVVSYVFTDPREWDFSALPGDPKRWRRFAQRMMRMISEELNAQFERLRDRFVAWMEADDLPGLVIGCWRVREQLVEVMRDQPGPEWAESLREIDHCLDRSLRCLLKIDPASFASLPAAVVAGRRSAVNLKLLS
jgi:hypothetical protein